MIELRKRSSSSSGSSNNLQGLAYSRVNDEDESVPMLNNYNYAISVPTRKSAFCAKFCFVFSLIAVLFLLVLASLLKQDSKYITISSTSAGTRPELASGVIGAVGMYAFCLVVSAYMWRKAVYDRIGDDELRRYKK